MDRVRFDDLAKQLATAGTSRRRLLRALGGLVAGAVVTGGGTQAAAALPVGAAGDFCETCYRNNCVGCLGSGCPGCRDLRAAEQALKEEEQLLQGGAIGCEAGRELCAGGTVCCGFGDHCTQEDFCCPGRQYCPTNDRCCPGGFVCDNGACVG